VDKYACFVAFCDFSIMAEFGKYGTNLNVLQVACIWKFGEWSYGTTTNFSLVET
jgi:hypothetical protein